MNSRLRWQRPALRIGLLEHAFVHSDGGPVSTVWTTFAGDCSSRATVRGSRTSGPRGRHAERRGAHLPFRRASWHALARGGAYRADTRPLVIGAPWARPSASGGELDDPYSVSDQTAGDGESM